MPLPPLLFPTLTRHTSTNPPPPTAWPVRKAKPQLLSLSWFVYICVFIAGPFQLQLWLHVHPWRHLQHLILSFAQYSLFPCNVTLSLDQVCDRLQLFSFGQFLSGSFLDHPALRVCFSSLFPPPCISACHPVCPDRTQTQMASKDRWVITR